ncbi:MAG TPA: Gfo/Idh/MocA family protein [Candidatus Wunengus sp. YC65]|uniref:Gfo/Idh/MocA family protein n=1 Tax=Candidatus Wunengus sp. YC65 TaxID=3367701 RepID=UPI004028043A
MLRSVCDSEEDVISGYSKKYAEVRYTTSREEILCNAEITAVVVATPAVTHYEIVKQSLLAGKDVFVEKPLAITVKQGEELISSGELGKIQYIYSNRLNIGKLRTEENILWSFAPHDISAILMLLEEEPIKVTASGGNYLSNDIYDITITILEFKNGIKGHIFVSWLHPYKEQKLIVVDSKAMAVFDDVSNEKLFLYPHKIMWKDGKIPVAQKANCQIIPFDKKEPLKEELKHFVGCIQEKMYT